jgi:hypothetical protein
MPDMNFLSAFANSPIELIILGCFVVLGILVWKSGGSLKLLKPLNEKVDSIIAHDVQQDILIKNNTKDVLRITAMNERLSIADRLIAFKRYKYDLKGNGGLEESMCPLIDAHPDVWEAVQKVGGE